MYVGITGTIAAGKGETARILKERGFTHYSFGDMLREEARRRGLDTGLGVLTDLANELRQEHGPGFLAELLLRKLEQDAPEDAVLESIRALGELSVLRRLPGFVLVSVDAPREVRYERLQRRGRNDNLPTFEAFCELEDRQLEGASHEQHLLAVMDEADIKIVNDGTLEELAEQVEENLGI